MEQSKKKPQPFQRHEDEGPTRLYVDAKPWESAPGPSEDERAEAAKNVLEQHTSGEAKR